MRWIRLPRTGGRSCGSPSGAEGAQGRLDIAQGPQGEIDELAHALDRARARALLDLLAQLREPERADVRAARLERVRGTLEPIEIAPAQTLRDVAQPLGSVAQEDRDELGQEAGVIV